MRTIWLVATLGSALAFPTYIPAAQVPGAVRSPCPGLNALANHGFLPRTGRNISLPVVQQAILDGMNVGLDFSTVAGAGALLTNGALARGGLVFDLDDLDEHNLIEHDASLSRKDVYFGDNHSFDKTIYSTMKSSARAGVYTPSLVGPVRAARLAQSTATDPQLTWLPQNQLIAYGEAALALSVMGDPVTGIANASFVNSLFEQERLPYELGWRPPLVPTTLASLALMSPRVQLTANDTILEVSDITASALKLVFGGHGLPGTSS